MPSDITIKCEVRNCRECGMRTIGSIGAAGLYWASLCQSCKDFADGMAVMQARMIANAIPAEPEPDQSRRTAEATARALKGGTVLGRQLVESVAALPAPGEVGSKG